jgi:tRNA (cytosine49-C5)-methyltransferase
MDEEPEFKKEFIERYSKLTDFPAFKKISLTYLRRCIRVNTLKISVQDLQKRLTPDWELIPVPWCPEGFWIRNVKDERRDIGNLLEHVLGYVYVQEAASMIPPVALSPQPGEVILDMCAAPGSKAGQITQMMEGTGLLVANDFKGDRLKALGLNLQRIGATNVLCTQMFGAGFKDQVFDRILVDAPCSGTGTIRKSYKTLRMWNPRMVSRISFTQKKLLDNAYSVLKPGGTLVYSTCTMEPEENEGVIHWLLEHHTDATLEEIDIPINRSPAILEFEGVQYSNEVGKCLRIWPQDNDTEGFFVAKIRKK